MLPDSITGNVVLFLFGFALLTGGAEFLVRGASRIAVRLSVPAVVVGLTIVAFGTSLPELLVSLLANLQGDGGSEIAIGNIVGSNIANIGLILGLAGLLAVIPVETHLVRREMPLLILVSIIFIIMAWPGSISRLNGIILTAGLLAFTFYSYKNTRTSPVQVREGEEAIDVVEAIDPEIAQPSQRPLVDLGFVAVGIIALVIGANWLVGSAQFIARAMGVSELIIGLSLVAVGTSLPELATSTVAVYRKEGDIAVGNVVGSNFFNMMFIGGLSSLIKPLPVPLHMRYFDFPVMLGLTVLVYLLALRKPHSITRLEAAVLLIAYVAYIFWLFFVNGTPAVG
jgi:cation:H+ antiporter